MDKIVNVAAALIWQDDKFMICQRPPHKARGLLWEFVGGKQEPQEDLRNTLNRECREELDIEVQADDVFMELVHEYPDITIKLTLFNAHIVSGTPKLLEHVDIKWILPSEIEKYEFCPADKDILTEILHRYYYVEPGIYHHYKGNDYEVLYNATHSETLEPMVVYKALYGTNGIWTRPSKMWNEEIVVNGKKVKRFSKK